VHALVAYYACMASKASGNRPTRPRRAKSVQYTVRDVPAHVDVALRRRARQEGKSLNRILRDALTHEAGISDGEVVHHDLDELAGRWEDDPNFDAAVAEQDRVDPDLWR